MYDLIPLFPVAVYKTQLRSLTLAENNTIQNIKIRNNKLGNQVTAEPRLLDREEFKDFNSEITKHLNEYIGKVLSTKFDCFITDSWMNITNPGEEHAMHCHTNSILSGVYYIDINDSEPSINFYRMTHPYMLNFVQEQHNVFNSQVWNLPVRNNELILFPSSTWHSVNKNTGTRVRLSIAFNTFVKGSVKNMYSGSELSFNFDEE